MSHATTDAETGQAGGDAETAWPLMLKERLWHRRQLFVVLLVAASATWCYIIGEYVGYYLPLWPGFFAMTAGAMIGMLLVTLAVVPTSSRYGIDSIQSAVPQFGRNGWVVTVLLQYASIIGWNSLLLIFFGKALAEFLNAVGVGGENLDRWVVPVGALAACGVVLLVLQRGATGLERVSMVLFFFIVGVGAWMIITLLVKEGDALSAAVPAYASDKQLDLQFGVEIGLVSLLSWWPYIGSMTRIAPSPKVAVLPSMLGMGLPVPILSLVGVAGILVLETSDPSVWLTQVGGNFFGALALLFVIAANLGTATAGIYASTVGLKAVPGFRKLSWNTACCSRSFPSWSSRSSSPTGSSTTSARSSPTSACSSPRSSASRSSTTSCCAGSGSACARSTTRARTLTTPTGGASTRPRCSRWRPASAPTSTCSTRRNTPSVTRSAFVGASLPAALVAAVVFVVVTFVLVRPMGKGGVRLRTPYDAC